MTSNYRVISSYAIVLLSSQVLRLRGRRQGIDDGKARAVRAEFCFSSSLIAPRLGYTFQPLPEHCNAKRLEAGSAIEQKGRQIRLRVSGKLEKETWMAEKMKGRKHL